MLTPEEIAAVSRSMIGHMTTDSAVRDAMDIDPGAAGANARFAAIFNAATRVSPAVTEADVPAIFASIREIVAATPALETGPTASIVVYVKHP